MRFPGEGDRMYRCVISRYVIGSKKFHSDERHEFLIDADNYREATFALWDYMDELKSSAPENRIFRISFFGELTHELSKNYTTIYKARIGGYARLSSIYNYCGDKEGGTEMKGKGTRFQFMHKGQIYTAVYEGGFAPIWGIYRGAQKRESRYVCGYNAWGSASLPSDVEKKFCETH